MMTASRYTASSQYGLVGLGAGPAPTPGVAMAADDLTGAQPATASTGVRVPKGSAVQPMDDPTFWLVASIGAIIGLAALSMESLPE